MKRLLLVGAAAASMMLGAGAASAATTASCSVPLGVMRAATDCTAANTVTIGATPVLTMHGHIGSIEKYYGDVQVNLKGASSGALMQLTCASRATTLLDLTSCTSVYTEGQFTPGEEAVCSGTGSGVGEFTVTCSSDAA